VNKREGKYLFKGIIKKKEKKEITREKGYLKEWRNGWMVPPYNRERGQIEIKIPKRKS